MSNRTMTAARTISVSSGLPPTSELETAKPCRKVLLVEDDDQVLRLVSHTLKSLGHEVVEAHDGEAALGALYNHSDIDCLFSDVVLPSGMNGVRLTREARAVRPGLRALLASVRSREEVRGFGEIPFDVTFIRKPYSLIEINSLLRRGTRKPARAASARRWLTDPNGLPFIGAANAYNGADEATWFSDTDCNWTGLT